MSASVDALMAFIDASPTPFHAVLNAVAQLDAAGFGPFDPTADRLAPSYVADPGGGALVAWAGSPEPGSPTRLIGAHTDSPNLRIRPRPDTGMAGFRQLAVEVYGGALVNSWLDRDLGLAGRVAVRDGNGGVRFELVRTDTPMLRVPQLAIHLDREINEGGLLLNRQQHLTPVWGLGEPREGEFREWLASLVGVRSSDVLAWDMACFDLQPAALLGSDRELLAAARLDNLCSCWGALEALTGVTTEPAAAAHRGAVVVLYDHEEVGSTTARGADSTWLTRVLEQRHAAMGGDRHSFLASLDRTTLLSADMAHATHPNYPERHEPRHWIRLGGGPVIKHNANARYATDAAGAAAFRIACDAAGVPIQEYSHRGDLACGSTIGPLAAAQLGVTTVDVGMAQLSMHSVREVMAASDVDLMVTSFTAWFTPTSGAEK